MIEPMGVDAVALRLSWKLTDVIPGVIVKGWEVKVGIDSAMVARGIGTAWKSGKRQDEMQYIVYGGKKLQPHTTYFWTVSVFVKGSKLKLQSGSHFETGMMGMENWKGAWISDTRDIKLKAAGYFRKTFEAGKKIKTARAYIACAGLYELSINGHGVGDHRLDPMYTRFDRRTLYVTYDVTELLKEGKNAIGILLGNGWYNHQSTAVWYFHEAPWRARPAFCMDLRITYTDDSSETIVSGKDWKTFLSPVIFNSIYTGEQYDARLEIPSWDHSSFNDSAWHEVVLRSAPSVNIVSQVMHPIRNVEPIPTTKLTKFNDTSFVFDLGRNIAGVSRITLQGSRGTIIRLKHGERLYANGHVDQSNIDVHYRPTDNLDPFGTDIYILKGGATESFSPRFNYKGFQFIEVTSSQPITLTKESVTGYFMHSDVPVAGGVTSSNPTINKIWQATNNSYLSNLFGYPTDCPQREKNGWTGDAQIAIETGLYNYDGITVYEKWMADHRDEQQNNGVLPSIIPTGGWGYEWGNGPDWTSTIAIIPWQLYLFYGDSRALSDCYTNIQRYVDHINEKYPSGLTDWGLGDWIPVKSSSPVEFTSTAYYYADVTILAHAAKLFRHDSAYQKYTALAFKIKEAFNKKYFDQSIFSYGTGLQTELSVALYWHLVPDEYIAKVATTLAKRVMRDSTKLDVGLLGTKAILNALSENGYASLAYQLASSEKFPSWGWWMVNGATTLYENWPIDAGRDISMNHIMFGEIGAWLYKGLGGIKPDISRPGFKNVLLHPNFVEGLDSFSCSHDGPYGRIQSSWKRQGRNVVYKIVIPPNSTASLSVDKNLAIYNDNHSTGTIGKSTMELTSGTYRFLIREPF